MRMEAAGISRRRRVLVIGGWSPGALPFLEQRTRHEFHEPAVPMPPAGCFWMFNPFFLVLVAFGCGAPWLFGRLGSVLQLVGMPAIVVVALDVLLALATVRLLVAGLVWFAVRHGVHLCSRAIHTFKPDVVVGFSWGGGIACWLLAECRWAGPVCVRVCNMCALGLCQCPCDAPICSPLHCQAHAHSGTNCAGDERHRADGRPAAALCGTC